MTDATILIPTYRHAALLPYALRSALEQQEASVEVFVVGDGVEDDTRAALDPFLSDSRVRFFDFPKGERHGEAHRHVALQAAAGRIVCYLADDDLLLSGHVAHMAALLEQADLAHSAPIGAGPDGSLWYWPIDLALPGFRPLLQRGDWNAISLTGTAHTLEAYRRLPHGWRPAPPGIWTDLYMWQQFLGLEGFRGRTGSRATHLHFPESVRTAMSQAERVDELERWWRRIHDVAFEAELASLVAETMRQTAIHRELRVQELQTEASAQAVIANELEERLSAVELEARALQQTLDGAVSALNRAEAAIAAMESTRTWRLRGRLRKVTPLRALLARRHAAR
jgi:GalNAc5-diNAcBac-PP-undecaprenol beta-1,3-glucosyltransferase